MPYLPTPDIESTEFPEAQTTSKDLQCQIQVIEDYFDRFYPLIDYKPLKQQPTEVSDVNTASGESGTTDFDPLYGESINPNSGQWEQAHGDSNLDATQAEVFDTTVQIHARVQRGQKDLDLHQYGFDKVRDVTVYIPLSLLDQHGITVQSGDRFVWDGDEYLVKEFTRTGWWMNSNTRLYMYIGADHARQGS